MKRALLLAARACGLFALCRWITRGQLRILCYHGIWIGPEPHYGDRLFMSAERFAARMALLARLGYRVIGLDEAMQRHLRGGSRARDLVITIDDAWLGTYRHMLPVLERHGYPATLYVTTYYAQARRPVLNVLLGYLFSRPGGQAVLSRLTPPDAPPEGRLEMIVRSVDALPTLDARWQEVQRLAGLVPGAPSIEVLAESFGLMTPEQLRDAAKRGLDIQLHTHTHRMHGQDPDRVAAEVMRNREELSTILARPPETFRHFCYPSGEHDPRVFDALTRVGVRSATTTEFGLVTKGDHPLALNRILDGQSVSGLELEAVLSGFWPVIKGLQSLLRQQE